MSQRRGRSPRRKPRVFEDLFKDLTLRTRRIIAAGAAVTILIGCLLISAAAGADFEHARAVVGTQKHEDAVIIGHEPRYRAESVPVIEVGGEEYELDYGWFLEGDEVGDSVRYVVDPENPSHLIAVGTPSDWKPSPLRDVLVEGAVVLISLIAGGVIASRFVPEDLEKAFGWFIDRRRRKRQG